MGETLQEKLDSKVSDWLDERIDSKLDDLEARVDSLIEDEVKTRLDID